MLFSEVIGHEVLKQRLIQGVNDSRISHAQLFLGSEVAGIWLWPLLIANLLAVNSALKLTRAALVLLVKSIRSCSLRICIFRFRLSRGRSARFRMNFSLLGGLL